jgi:hypothetical protein
MFKVFAISGCVGVFVVVVILILGQLINIGPSAWSMWATLCLARGPSQDSSTNDSGRL